MKHTPPSVDKTAFCCAHCDVLTSQTWFSVFAKNNSEDSPKPFIIRRKDVANTRNRILNDEEDENLKKLLEFYRELCNRKPLIAGCGNRLMDHIIYNLNISKCFACHKLSIWIYDKLIYPLRGNAPSANPDMPDDVREDYDEASMILDYSPRGAAALLRLAVEKLCNNLGDPDKSINDNIREFVKNGLDQRVQKALDAVRVIGNDAVHPGKIDLDDDRETAEKLFRLLNIIVGRMISDDKLIDDVYKKLPEEKLKAIAERDGKPSTKPKSLEVRNKGQQENDKKK